MLSAEPESGEQGPKQQHGPGGGAPAAAEATAVTERDASLTTFTVQDVCSCSGHSARGSCTVCSPHVGTVAQTSYMNFLDYCSIFQAVVALQQLRPSAAEATLAGCDLRGLVAGEIHFPSFVSMVTHALDGCASAEGRGAPRFLDLGSGLGRAVVAYALCFSPWREEAPASAAPAGSGPAEEAGLCPRSGAVAVGVEIRSKVDQLVVDVVLPAMPAELRAKVQLLCGDMFDMQCGWADLLLVNATGLGDVVFARLRQKLEAETHTGARIMCLSVPLVSDFFVELPASGRQYRMS